MCGICGIVFTDRRRQVDQTILSAMNQRILHRGPDDCGQFLDQNVGFAMRRLSIIDPGTGHQPLSNETRDIWIVYNGEIYNHRQVRSDMEARGHHYQTQADTETVVHLYEEYGDDCVKHLRGMFAFAIWDGQKRRVFAARDRLGIKPFYYRWDGSSLVFASEIKAILAFPGVSASLNRSVLREYLTFGYISGAETMFEGIRKLMPGHTLELDEGGQLTIQRYWDLNADEDKTPYQPEQYVQQYRHLLEDSVSSHLMSDVPVGVFLSGGLDSSAIAALCAKLKNAPIATFSVGYGERAYSELTNARKVANHIQSEHHEVLLSREEFFDLLPLLTWHEDEPIAWPSSVSLYVVARMARALVKVVLTGEGSDETLGGYSRYALTLLNLRMNGIYSRVTPSALRRMLREVLSSGVLPDRLRRKLEHTFLMRDGASWESFYFDNFYSAFAASEQSDLLHPEVLEDSGSAYYGSMLVWEKATGKSLHRMLYTDINSYLIELLMKQDQMSMAASIESRVPFLDHLLVEFSARIPGHYNVNGAKGKLVLKEAVKDILPKSIIYQRKLGFPTPWKEWISGRSLDDVERMLVGPRCTGRRLFNRETVKRLFAEQRAKKRDHSTKIWRLLSLEVWSRAFIDGEIPGLEVERRNAEPQFHH